MKILQFNGPWQFSIEEAPTPSFGPEELLIRADAVGICGSDVHGFTGESGRRKPGMVMGHEVAGTVVKAGAKVASLRPGDCVAVYPTLGCGVCRHCLAGMEHICPESGFWGSMPVTGARWQTSSPVTSARPSGSIRKSILRLVFLPSRFLSLFTRLT